jgi:hypothetical protein
MKNVFVGVLVVFIGIFIVGCEWETSSDGDSWNSSYEWADFGGVYRPTAGRTYVVSEFGPGDAGSPGSAKGASTSIGSGNGLIANFNGILNSPVIAGSVTVTDSGAQSLTDDGSGGLTGNGTGTINYKTGAITASFSKAPAMGNNVIVTYNYAVAGSPGNPQPGSPKPIYTITVDQTGNRLSFRDSNGMTYSGDITGMSGGGGDGTVSGAVVANFNVTGADGSKISGVLQGQYTPNTGVSGAGTLDRIMNGTYSSAGGATGDVIGSAGTVNVIVTPPDNGGTNAVPAP